MTGAITAADVEHVVAPWPRSRACRPLRCGREVWPELPHAEQGAARDGMAGLRHRRP
jgi:hypothetical protein